ncbi:MAG: Unknown protein [uncultured Sulfurovum sp.]|uniref:Transglycosylase SLT domain-containing protein n=1 Tax=uncultured Sulfurovum sp. TaxID=269237 RepID=A0A6S6UFC9_9BACT|nr:MAG: Unknown protein [uncultured Sulfurovum sp.]
MNKIIRNIVFLLILSELLVANCSSSKTFWKNKLSTEDSIETFFMNNYKCQKYFYTHLNTVEKIYFDTVLYPNNLSERAYINRWKAMFLNDKAFFKQFTFFNNYFMKHHMKISKKELSCFQKQRGFTQDLSKNNFYNALKQRDMLNDVSYLYPLIRWAYVHKGIDMQLSRERVRNAEDIFGIKKGKVGDAQQYARFIALFSEEYESVSADLSLALNIPKIKAYKLLLVITYLESRGNIFAVSTTGAFGPTQLTLHYYMMYGEPNNPFSVKASLVKLANKFIYYKRIGKSLDSAVIAYKSGSLTKCQNSNNLGDVDCRYYYDYKRYMGEMKYLTSKGEISRHLTGKSYFNKDFKDFKRHKNRHNLKHYEPYQYALLKQGILGSRAVKSKYLHGSYFNSLGKMKRSDIYELQNHFGVHNIGVISDKNVCY